MDQTLRIPRAQFVNRSFGVTDVIPGLIEMGRRHDLLWHMTVRHLRGQYKQSVLGYAWAILNPLSLMLTLSFVFSVLLRFESGDIPYPLFLLMGLIPWLFFATAVSSATDSITGAFSLVTKVYFPREVLPTAAVLTKIVDMGFGLMVLIPLMIYFGYPPQWTIVWVPVLLAIHFLFVLGMALPLAALNLFFHDVRFLVGVVLTLWFYLTPVIYPVDIVPEKYKIVFDLNPNALFINAYRRVVLEGGHPGTDRLLLGLGIATLTFLIGYYLFKRMEPRFADRI
jgi:ABC-type polysaccharide/polyol phosphate export permease